MSSEKSINELVNFEMLRSVSKQVRSYIKMAPDVRFFVYIFKIKSVLYIYKIVNSSEGLEVAW